MANNADPDQMPCSGSLKQRENILTVFVQFCSCLFSTVQYVMFFLKDLDLVAGKFSREFYL